ncbi:hypothetical protein DACRYDRAFT_22518 [Dacryopinax primogenitus]|uniref:CFEM domain-containing protein n=1 Tax=Dacryopinax primogenitus (strain DJM 731) TaxID=1858805 RepID=M5GBH8_DACPD|nr:uncharacterized protein DACRYDRAFT_22518 [Dacryopinax primogenitus]EJU01358.1 hypothetical protein DACRYDRAFT_22518 [Dacryopinax primogenitus]
MRFSLLLAASAPLVVFAGLLPRQSPPACLTTCLGMLPLNLTTCDPTDFTCLCSSSVFLTAVTQCIDAQCDTADIESAEQYAVATCGAAGVVVTPAPIPGTATSSGSATSSPSSTLASGSNSTTSSSSASSPSTSPSSSGSFTLNPAQSVLLAGLAAVAGLMLSL